MRARVSPPWTKTVNAGALAVGKLLLISSATRIDALPGTSQPPPERWSLWCSENQPPAAMNESQTRRTARRRFDTVVASPARKLSTISSRVARRPQYTEQVHGSDGPV